MEIPLTSAQMAMVHELVFSPGATGNVTCTSTMVQSRASALDVQTAWRRVCERIPLLRSKIAMREDGFCLETGVGAVITEVSAVSDVRSRAVREDLAHVASQPFFLEGEALIRLHARLDGERLVVAIPAQHAIADVQTSVLVSGAFFSELRDLEGGGDADPILDGADFAQFLAQESQYLTSRVVAQDRQFWQGQLEGFSTDPLPQLNAMTGGGQVLDSLEPWVRFEVEGAARRAVDEITVGSGSSAACVFLTAYMRTLANISTTSDVAVVLPVLRRSKRFKNSVGNFSQSTIVRADVGGTFLDALDNVDAQFRGALRHGRLPVQEMVKSAASPESVVRTSFLFEPPSLGFGSSFVIGDHSDIILSGYRMLPYPLIGQVGQFPFRLQIGSMGDRYLGAVHIDPDRLDLTVGSAIARGVLDELAEAAQEREGWTLCQGNLAGSGWRHPAHIGTAGSPESETLSVQDTVLDRIRRVVLSQPGAVAASDQDSSITYGEMWDRAAQVCEALGGADPRPVAVYASKGVKAVVGIIGVLLAGRSFVAVDPAYPEQRRNAVLGTDLSAVVGDHTALAAVPDFVDKPLISVPTDGNMSREPATVPADLQGPAYVVFTSGSTGEPKGVWIDHVALAASTRARDEVYERSPERFLHLSSLSFDSAYAGLFWTLVRGGEVVLVDMSTRPSVSDLTSLIANRGITHLLAIPSLYLALLEDAEAATALTSLRQVVVAGEACQPRVRDAHQSVLPHSALTNEYGPSEAAIWCTFDHLSDGEITIGGAIPGTQLMVLDDRGDSVELGGTGELFVNGNLAIGYLGRPRETAQSFVPDPESKAGGRRYRTGDLVRRRQDGRLDFLGRVDGQLKVNGFRIEPEEVEAALQSITGLTGIATHIAGGGGSRLALLVESEESIDVEALCGALAGFLPVTIATQDVFPVIRLPRGTTGKLDRENAKALVGKGRIKADSTTTDAESTRRSLSMLLEAVSRSTGQPSAPTQSYLHQGGDSIGAMRVCATLRSRGARIEPKALLSASPLSEVATQVMWEEAGQLPPSERVTAGSDVVPETIHLSRRQRGMLLQSSLVPEGGIYIEQLVLDLNGELDRDRLARAWRDVFEKHPILRAAVVADELSPRKISFPAVQDVPVQVGLKEVATADEWKRWLEEDREAGFSNSALSLSRVMIGDGPSGTRCVWTHHHAICDGWSLPVVLESLADAYSGREEVVSNTQFLWPVDQEPREMCARSGALEHGVGQFVDVLAEDEGGPSSHQLDTIEIDLPDGTSQDARRLGVTMGALVNIAWSATLAATFGRRYVRHGLVVSGREGSSDDLQRAVGLFIRTVPIDGSWATGMPLTESIENVREQVLGSLVGGQAGVEDLDSVVVVENYPLDPHAIDFGGDVKLVGADLLEKTEFPVVLQVRTWPKTVLHLYCDLSRVPRSAARDLATTLEGILHKLAQSKPADTVESLLALTAEKFSRIASRDESPEPIDVLDRWRTSCSVDPKAVAVEFSGERLTRLALDQRRRVLADRLIAHGAGPGDVIAVSVDSHMEPVSALLAVMSVGASWICIDPDTPPLRRAAMIEDSGVQHVISWVDGEIAISGNVTRSVPLSATTSKLSAYTIYTSGSTGKPKAVVVSRESFSRHLLEVNTRFALRHDDVVLVFGSLGFDASLEQLFGSLVFGAVAVFRPNAMLDPIAVNSFMEDREVSVFNPPTGFWRRFSADVDSSSAPKSLRLIVVGGEALSGWMTAGWPALGRRLINAYGPTEAVVTSLTYEVGPQDSRAALPIGTSFGTRNAYVLSDELHGVGPHVVGDLWLAGVLADGYHHNARATAGSFVPDPWSGVPGARMYRTGDLAWRNAEGTLTFVGRADRQLKVRGYRLDPAEIEQVALSVQKVRSARVVSTRNADGASSITCFVEPEKDSEDQKGLGEQVAERLGQVLPGYLVPRSVVLIDDMPVTTTGKVDEAQLIARLQSVERSAGPSDRVAGGIDQVLRRIWGSLLGGPDPGQGFISSGGDSLSALEFIALARRESIRIEVDILLGDGAIEEIAAAAWLAPGRGVSGVQPIKSTNLPPAIGWFRDRVNDSAPSRWHMAVAMDLPALPHAEDVQRALEAVVEAHPILRAALVDTGEDWTFLLTDAEVKVLKPAPDRHAGQEEDDVIEELLELADLRSGTPIAAGLIPRKNGASTLILAAHHFVIDIVSFGVVLDDLYAALEQLGRGEQPALQPEYTSVHEWVEWLSDPERVGAAAQRAEIAHRGAAGREMGLTGTELESVEVQIDIPITVLGPALDAGCSVEEVLQVAAALAVGRENDLRHVVLEVETHGRDLDEDAPDLSRTVGWLTALFPLELSIQDPGRMVGELRGRRRFIGRTGQRPFTPSLAGPNDENRGRSPGVDVGVNYAGNVGRAGGRAGSVRSVGQGRLRAPELRRPVETAVDAWSLDDVLRVTVQHRSFVSAHRVARALRTAFDEVGGLVELPILRGAVPSDLRDNNLSMILPETGPLDALAPLGPGQEGMLLRTLADGRDAAYVEQLALSVPHEVDPEALVQGLRSLGNYYPVLRGSVRLDGLGEAILVIPSNSEVPVESIHASSGLAQEQLQNLQEYEVNTLAAAEGKTLFQALVVTGPQLSLIITFHHLCLDGWTVAKLLDLLGVLILSGGNSDRPPDLRMLDHMVSARIAGDTPPASGRVLTEEATTFPHEIGSGTDRAPSARNVDLVDRFTGPTTQRLRSVAARSGVTLGSFLHLVWALVLAPNPEATVRFGTIQQQRPDGHQDAPGMYSTASVLTVRIGDARFASELATAIHLSLVGSVSGGELAQVDETGPYETIVVVDDSRGATGQQDFLGAPLQILGTRERTGLPLTFSAIDHGECLEIALNHDLSVMASADAEGIRERLVAVVEALANGTDGLDQLINDSKRPQIRQNNNRTSAHDTKEPV